MRYRNGVNWANLGTHLHHAQRYSHMIASLDRICSGVSMRTNLLNHSALSIRCHIDTSFEASTGVGKELNTTQ